MGKNKYIRIAVHLLLILAILLAILTGIIIFLLPRVAESAVNSLLKDWSKDGNMTVSIHHIGFFQTQFSFNAIYSQTDDEYTRTQMKYGILRYHPWELVTIKYIRSIELHQVQIPLRIKNNKLDMPLLNIISTNKQNKISFDYKWNKLPLSFGRLVIDGTFLALTPLKADMQYLAFTCVYDAITSNWPNAKIQVYIRNQKNAISIDGYLKPPFLTGNINAAIEQDQLFKYLFPAIHKVPIRLKSQFSYNIPRRELVKMTADLQNIHIAPSKELQIKCSPRLELNTTALYKDLNSGRLSMKCHGVEGKFYGCPFQINTSFQWKWKEHDVKGAAKIRLFNEKNESLEIPFHLNQENEQWNINVKIKPIKNDELKYQLDGITYLIKNVQCDCNIKTLAPPFCKLDIRAAHVRLSDSTMDTFCDQLQLKAYGTTKKLDMQLEAKNYYGSFSNGDTVITLPFARISSTYANEKLDFILSSENGTCIVKPAGISARSVKGKIPFQVQNRKLSGRGVIMSTDTSVYGYLMGDTSADLQIDGEKMNIQVSNNSLFYNRKMTSALVYGNNGWENTSNKFSTSAISVHESANVTKKYIIQKSNNAVHADIRSLLGYDPERSFLFSDSLQNKIKWFFTPFQIPGEMLNKTYAIPQKFYQSCLDFFSSQKQPEKK